MTEPDPSLLGCSNKTLLEIAKYLQDEPTALRNLRQSCKRSHEVGDSALFEDVHLDRVPPSGKMDTEKGMLAEAEEAKERDAVKKRAEAREWQEIVEVNNVEGDKEIEL
ncbi:uncharacterized protein BDZ99DRAFT_524140 [Mytilinidion resinicola]|uniref:F-box domain-containing protein n=1 Tax=Mytilinidion resinicola TaxID=574789 RepID=A0A6A6YAP4_9PEZI|nr:uncharacterized protein BDZ99DRAFT_524140 [Mytilinidion resinicola]KAF2805896.1 hypothetical protein BDZ99DRAFT_524140 [Mytilinidion resinicola]